MNYTQLTQAERYQIYALNKAEHNQTEIAIILGRDKSTISRELRRNVGLRGYRPQQAQRLTEERRQAKVRSCIPHSLWRHVERLLREDWSPEQIHLWLKAEYTVSISHEWLYQYILRDKACGGTLYHHLRCKNNAVNVMVAIAAVAS